VFRYTDVAVSLKKKNFIIKEVSDLKDKTIAAYQNATDLLGEAFGKMAESNPGYEEFAQPFITTNLVVKDRKDIRIGDIFIFLYDINRPLHKGKIRAEEFATHYIFPPVYSYMAFKDKKICEEFNRALKQIKENGTFEAVYRKYERYLRGIPEK
ncbi:transporter substrate-binding domain-containing protein, partial [Desulfococcaceae bacterium HSG8]|nr:transporter substrate-binding domain-containing protein [Desulfococcaceae bacterium HSG8]